MLTFYHLCPKDGLLVSHKQSSILRSEPTPEHTFFSSESIIGSHLTPLLLVHLHLSPNNTVLTVFELTHHLRPFSRSAGFFRWVRNPTRPQWSPHSKLSPCCASPPRRCWEWTTNSSPAATKSSPCSLGHYPACRTGVFFWRVPLREQQVERQWAGVCWLLELRAEKTVSLFTSRSTDEVKWPPLFGITL